MNYIIEVYSDGMFIPITGTAVMEQNDAVILEFGIDDHFNNPEWMTQNVYKIPCQAYSEATTLPGNSDNIKIDTFLIDAQRDIMTHLDQNGFLPVQHTA